MRFALFLTTTLLSLPTAAAAQVVPGYTPQDKDERGIWMVMEEEERRLKASNFVMRDPALNTYVRDVFCRTVGKAACNDVRIYIVRTPYFNASMAPNGMMTIWSGLFLRTRDEAQMAAVLGHEYTHFQKQHSLRLFRDVKKKTNAFSFLSIPLDILTGGLGGSVAQLAVVASIYGFSREMEREADTGSVGLLAKSGYDPMAASRVWEHVRAEMDATAEARGKKSRKDKNGGLFATHPPTLERMTGLKTLAEKTGVQGTPQTNRDAYRRALAPHWANFIDDQIKLNDFGATEMLLANLAADGWSGELLYARGELYRARGKAEDLKAAAGFYKQAIGTQQAPIEAQRGLGLALLRTGDATGGKAALKTYLTAKPDATDSAMLAAMAKD
jgi:beta-barrel assembly-enhancing protease